MSWGKLAEALSTPAAGAGVRRYPARAATRPNHLAAITVPEDFWGVASDMLPPTRSEAMSVPAMARARHIITVPARLPLLITPTDYRYPALIRQPDPARTRMAVLTDTFDDLLFDGIALWRTMDRYGHDNRPRSAERISADRRAYDPDTQTWLIDDEPVPDIDLIWFEGPHAGVLTFGGRALRAAVRLERAYRATASNPAVAIELHQVSGAEMSGDEITALVAEAQQAVQARGVLFTNEATELRTHVAAAENLLIAGRNAAAVDVARMTGLPAPVIDAHAPGSSGTYANVQARLREARDIGVDAYAAAVTQRLSLDDVLPRGVSCAFDWDALLREGFTERMNGYAAAQAAGVYTVDECRALERGPIPEVDA